MERFPTELLYVLAFLAIIVFNFITQRAARRRQQQEQAEQALAPEPAPVKQAPVEQAPLEDIWGRSAAAAPAPVAVVAPRPAPPAARAEPRLPRRIHPARALLKDKRDLRRAVVLMMVLGPCRAQEPPER
jgi:hypothetical protein